MPLITDLTKKPAFKKKPYRPWDLLGQGSYSHQSPAADGADTGSEQGSLSADQPEKTSDSISPNENGLDGIVDGSPDHATEENPGVTARSDGHRRPKNQPGTTGDNRGQHLAKPGTTGDNQGQHLAKPGTTGDNQGQHLAKPGTTGDNEKEKPEQKRASPSGPATEAPAGKKHNPANGRTVTNNSAKQSARRDPKPESPGSKAKNRGYQNRDSTPKNSGKVSLGKERSPLIKGSDGGGPGEQVATGEQKPGTTGDNRGQNTFQSDGLLPQQKKTNTVASPLDINAPAAVVIQEPTVELEKVVESETAKLWALQNRSRYKSSISPRQAVVLDPEVNDASSSTSSQPSSVNAHGMHNLNDSALPRGFDLGVDSSTGDNRGQPGTSPPSKKEEEVDRAVPTGTNPGTVFHELQTRPAANEAPEINQSVTKSVLDEIEQPGTTTGDNRGQHYTKPGTTGDKPSQSTPQPGTCRPLTGDNRGQHLSNESQSTGILLNPSETTGDAQGQTPHLPGTTEDKKNVIESKRADIADFVPGLLPTRPLLNELLSPVYTENNRGQPGTVPYFSTHRPLLEPGTTGDNLIAQPGTITGDNWGQQPRTTGDNLRDQNHTIPTSAQQLQILRYLFKMQQQAGLGFTARIKRSLISVDLSIPFSGIKRQIDRLCWKGYLERVDARDGRGDSGTVYRVPSTVVVALRDLVRSSQPGTTGDILIDKPGTSTGDNRGHQLGTTGDINWGQPPPVSSSNLNNTNQQSPSYGKSLAEKFQTWVATMELDELGIGANDLVQIWRSEIFKELSDFQTSLEHISFYVRSKSGEGIEKPKAWMMKQLNRGYYAAPVGFKSREQQFEEAKLADIQNRVQEIQQIKRKQFEAGCEIWLMGLDEDLRRKLLPSGVKAESPAGKAVLREAYAKEVGFNL